MKKLILFLFLIPVFLQAQKIVTTKTITTVKDKNGVIIKSDSSLVTYTVLPDSVLVPYPVIKDSIVYIDTCITAPPVNHPPIANAGTDKTITLPINTITLTGTGSDPDNDPITYKWTRTATGEILSNSTTVNLSFPIAGNYIYTFTVTDDKGLSSSDNIMVTVNPEPVNQLPTANAGADKTITLPTNSVTLTGSGSDPDGTIVSYSWAKVSGSGTASSPSSATTNINGLLEGISVWKLTVTDNKGATATDNVNIVVNPEPTQPPTGIPIPLSFIQNTNDYTRPFSGFEKWIGSYQVSIPNVSQLDEYDRFGWGQLEPSQNNYNFNPIGDKIKIAIDKKGKFSFGIMTYAPGASSGWKEVTKYSDGSVAMFPQYVHTQMQGDALKDWKVDNGNWVPNWNSEYYLSGWERLYKSLYQWLNTTTYKGVTYKDAVNYIDIRGFGEFGEWHMYYEHGSEPSNLKETETSLTRIIKAVSNNIPDIWLVALSDGVAPGNNQYVTPNVSYLLLTGSNQKGKFGIRKDHMGSTYFPSEDWKYNGITTVVNGEKLGDLFRDGWQQAPYVGEPALGSGNGYSYMDDDVLKYHFSVVGNGNYGGVTNSNIIAANKVMGYRLTLTGGQLITNEGQLSVSLNWSNTGNAPLYEDATVYYELRQGSNVVRTLTSSFSPTMFLPGTKSVTDNFSGIQSGTYDLYLMIKNNYRNMPLSIQGNSSGYLLKSGISL